MRLGPILVTACFSDAPPLEETSEGSGGTSSADATTMQSATMPSGSNDVGEASTGVSEVTGGPPPTTGDTSVDDTGAPETSGDTGVPITCGDGVVDANEDCDDRNTDPGDGCHSDCTVYRRVFVTSEPIAGGMGGLDDADGHCQAAVDAVGWRGTFRAWLSDDAMSAGTRLSGSEHAYRMPDGTLVAADWADVLDGDLVSAIYLNEHGASVEGSDLVWTGTTPMGVATGPNCTDWSTNAGMGRVGVVDWAEAAQWTETDDALCSLLNRLYCFEQ